LGNQTPHDLGRESFVTIRENDHGRLTSSWHTTIRGDDVAEIQLDESMAKRD
jgi:hypothetical protein